VHRKVRPSFVSSGPWAHAHDQRPPTARALLHLLAAHAGLVVTHQQLLKEVWGKPSVNIQYLRILMRKLRQKVEPDPSQPRIIATESGVGYRLDTSQP